MSDYKPVKNILVSWEVLNYGDRLVLRGRICIDQPNVAGPGEYVITSALQRIYTVGTVRMAETKNSRYILRDSWEGLLNV